MAGILTDTIIGNLLAAANAIESLQSQGLIDSNNSSNIPLEIDGRFEGGWTDVSDYGSIVISVFSDEAAVIDGLDVQWSHDGITVVNRDCRTPAAGKAEVHVFLPVARYFRLFYTNGLVAQESFTLQTIIRIQTLRASNRRILDGIIGDDDAELTKSVLSAQDELTGIFGNLKSFDGALNVTDGLVHEFGINLFFSRELGVDTNPSSAITAGDRVITLDSVAGLVPGDWLKIEEGATVEFTFLKILAITGNDVTVNRPVDNDYTTAADVKKIDFNMNVNGSITPVAFRVTPPAGLIWQFTRLMTNLIHSTAADDSKFGNLAALSRGVLVRTHRTSDAVTFDRTVTQWFANVDMKNDQYDVVYTDKAGPGVFGTSARWTFTKMGFIAEASGDNGDYLEILIQDDLSSLAGFTVKAQGRLFGT